MSDVVEKTLASLPSFLSQNLLKNVGSKSMASLNRNASTRAFQTFIKVVGNSRTELEEDQLIKKELCSLQERLGQPDVSHSQMRDYLTRLVYCKSLGYDVSFCYVHALKLAHQASGLDKRMGYMASSLLLHENHECILLFISTLQKDLKSTNFVDNCMALTVAGSLVNTEMIPMLLPSVLEKLTHKQQLVRMKAVMCLHQFYLKAPALLHHCHGDFNKMLCDKDPGVVTCTLHLYHSLIKERPEEYIHLGSPMIKLLDMVVQRKISTTFDYHNIPSPWLQILLLKILAILGSSDENLSIAMAETLLDVLERSTVKENIAIAIMYECIETITKIHPQPKILEKAVKVVGGLLHSANHNFRYLGLKSLRSLTKISHKYSVDYQMLVVECLEETDPVIQRKTFDLLLELSGAGNIQLICKKLLDHIRKLPKFQHADIVSKISDVVLLHSKNVQWYVGMICSLCDDRCVHVPENIIDKVLVVIDKGIQRESCQKNDVIIWCENYLTKKEDCSAESLKILTWVLGQYGVVNKENAPLLVKKLSSYFCEYSMNQINIQTSILTALIKLISSKSVSAEEVINSLEIVNVKSLSMDLQQRLKEIKLISSQKINFPHLLDQTEKMDFTLSFLDDFVSESLESGSAPYFPKHLRLSNAKPEVGYEADYETILESESDQSMSVSVGSLKSPNTSAPSNHSRLSETKFTDLNFKGVPKIWSKEGVLLPTKPDIFPNELPSSPQNQATDNGSSEIQNEEVMKKQEFAAALFGHINVDETKSKDPKFQSMLNSDFLTEDIELKNSKTGNWKQVHESAIQNIDCDKGHDEDLASRDEHFQLPTMTFAGSAVAKEEVNRQPIATNDNIIQNVHNKSSIYDESDVQSDDG